MGIFSWREAKSHSDGGLKGPLDQWLTCLLSQGNSLQMFSFTYEQCMVMVFLLPLSRWCGTHAGEVRVCPASVFDLKRLSSTAPFWGCAHLCDRARLSRQDREGYTQTTVYGVLFVRLLFFSILPNLTFENTFCGFDVDCCTFDPKRAWISTFFPVVIYLLKHSYGTQLPTYISCCSYLSLLFYP